MRTFATSVGNEHRMKCGGEYQKVAEPPPKVPKQKMTKRKIGERDVEIF